MNSFILGSKGFLKSMIYDREKREKVFEWTLSVRDAQRFKRKAALGVIERNGIEGSVWNPYVEDVVKPKPKWKVVQMSRYSFTSDKSSEWRPVKVNIKPGSDINYLVNKGEEKSNDVLYDSYGEALKVCKQKNLEIIEELERKMREMSKDLIVKQLY